MSTVRITFENGNVYEAALSDLTFAARQPTRRVACPDKPKCDAVHRRPHGQPRIELRAKVTEATWR